MPGLMKSDMLAGTKRPLQPGNSDNPDPAKRRRLVTHNIKHKQSYHEDPVLAPQDDLFIQSQLLRAISLSLHAVGFDGALPSALEALRAEVNEYMLHFLATVTQSMTAGRRTQPIPQDFIFSLSRHGVTPSSLLPHLKQPLPASMTQPAIPPPPPVEPPPVNLEGMLGKTLSGASDKAERKYIPAHFPNFPSKHTWQATSVYTSRETDPRKIRERATQEGILAEQALRKLMAASQSGKQNKGQSDQKKRSARQELDKMWEETMEAVLKDEEAAQQKQRNMEDADYSAMDTQGQDGGGDGKMQTAMMVDYERKYHRKAAQGNWDS